jgi:acyl-CoA synthetase (AMP-forming)/AMP-acid ligase II
MLLHDYLIRSAMLFPEKTALWCGEASYTYLDLFRRVKACADLLVTLGLRKGDRVALWLPNSAEEVVGLFATWMAGGCAVPIGASTPLERCLRQINHCGASLVVASDARMAALTAQPGQAIPASVIMNVHASPSHVSNHVGESGAPPRRQEPLDAIIDLDLAAIIYTSGSSGTPKGVTHTHRSIDSATESINGYLQNGPEDVILSVLQLNFSYGLLQLLGTFRTGGTLVLETGIGYPYEIVRQFSRHRVTGFAGAPTIWAMLLQLTGIGSENFASVGYITNAAAAMPGPFVPRLAELFSNAKIFLMHGMTECLRTGYLPPEEALTNPTSIGRPMQNVDLWIADESGNRLGPGETGELVIQGSTLMAGYWNDPDGTAQVVRPGRYPWERCLYSGDMFRMDERGYFYFVARKDDIIKSRGEKVSPVEVEAVIYQLPAVRECRIIGVPDELLGNRVRAEVVLREGGELDEKQLKAHCSQHLEPYKVPHDVAFVAGLPKTEGGKIVRKQGSKGSGVLP